MNIAPIWLPLFKSSAQRGQSSYTGFLHVSCQGGSDCGNDRGNDRGDLRPHQVTPNVPPRNERKIFVHRLFSCSAPTRTPCRRSNYLLRTLRFVSLPPQNDLKKRPRRSHPNRERHAIRLPVSVRAKCPSKRLPCRSISSERQTDRSCLAVTLISL